MNVPILFCICSPSQMILLVLLWFWSNEDLLSLGFHEFLVIGLLIQPLLELEVSVPLCVIDASRSISLPATHTIFSLCCTFESLCLDTELGHSPATSTHSLRQLTNLLMISSCIATTLINDPVRVFKHEFSGCQHRHQDHPL